MSLKTQRSEYAILAILGLITGLVLLAMVWSGLVRQDRLGRIGVRTTRSTSVDATLVCYTLFERLGVAVERTDEMFTATRHNETGVVFAFDPLVPMGTGEVAELSDWLYQGGVFVTTEVPRGLPSALKGLARDLPRSSRDFAPVLRRDRSAEPRFAEVPTETQALPLARDVQVVGFAGVSVLDANAVAVDSPSALTPLFADRHGTRIAARTVGHGCIILVSDSSFLANGLVAQADNAVLATNLVSYALAQARHEKMVFDEYHFGYGSRNQGLTILGGMLLTTSAGWAVLSLTVAGILVLIHKGRQFGPRRGLAEERRRSKTEYVYAVGATFRAVGAHRLTLQSISMWFRQRVTSAVGLVPSASNEMVAHELARRGTLDSGRCRRILDDCDRLVAGPRISERQLRTMVERLVQIEREIFNGSGDSKRFGR